MTPYDFKNKWIYPDEPLSPLTLERLNKFNLLPNTKEFLSIAGLPIYASPYLSFANDTDDIVYGINKLTDQFDFLDEDYNKYIVIGSCRDGDAIAIDISDNDKILELDHEDLFSSMFFNSSINALADFLIIYKDFEQSVLTEHGEEGHRNGYFTDIQFDKMRERMTKANDVALIEKGFWKDELEMLLSLRQEYLDNV